MGAIYENGINLWKLNEKLSKVIVDEIEKLLKLVYQDVIRLWECLLVYYDY